VDARHALDEQAVEVPRVVGEDDVAGAGRVGAVGAAVGDDAVPGAERGAHALALDFGALEAAGKPLRADRYQAEDEQESAEVHGQARGVNG
jgi:hypothetical protein